VSAVSHSTEKAVERDYFMSAEEARDFGLVDKILEKRRTTKVDGK